LLIGRWRGGRIAASGSLRDGAVSIDIGDAGLYGGRLVAAANGAMAGDEFVGSITTKVGSMPAGPPLKDLTGITRVDGLGTLSLSLEGRGATWRGVLNSLAGEAMFALADGTVSGLDLGGLVARLNGEEDSGDGAGTEFNAAGTITIANGAARTRNLEATGSGFRVDISAEASLSNGALSGTGTLTVIDPTQVRPLPFEVAGTWMAPALYPGTPGASRRSGIDTPKTFADRAP
jgi:uncharacterized protein involved in outer membrane biogenesis